MNEVFLHYCKSSNDVKYIVEMIVRNNISDSDDLNDGFVYAVYNGNFDVADMLMGYENFDVRHRKDNALKDAASMFGYDSENESLKKYLTYMSKLYIKADEVYILVKILKEYNLDYKKIIKPLTNKVE